MSEKSALSQSQIADLIRGKNWRTGFRYCRYEHPFELSPLEISVLTDNRITVINDSLDLSQDIFEALVRIKGLTIEGDLTFTESNIKWLELENLVIRDNLTLDSAVVEGEAKIINVKVGKRLNLLTKSGPKAIITTPESAQYIHWATPNVPLILQYKEEE